nr:hypothetical protein [Brevundimonas sp. UBA5713]
MALRLVEAAGVDRRGRPFGRVAVGGDGFLTAAQLGAGLGGGLFHPLEIFDAAGQQQAVGRDAQLAVGTRAAGSGRCGQMHKLAFIGRINAVCSDRHNDARPFVIGADRLDRTSLVPRQQNDGNQHGHEADQHALDGIADAREPRGVGGNRHIVL